MFISKKKLKKKLIEAAVEIYLLNDPSKASGDTKEERMLDFYYRCGNANALGYLCSRMGVWTEFNRQVKPEKANENERQ